MVFGVIWVIDLLVDGPSDRSRGRTRSVARPQAGDHHTRRIVHDLLQTQMTNFQTFRNLLQVR